MVKVKAGVQPRNLVIMAAIANQAVGLPHEIVITSGTDGSHMVGSKHYSGEALDVRISNFPNKEAVATFARLLRLRLGGDYDVVIEADHLHIEYDPT